MDKSRLHTVTNLSTKFRSKEDLYKVLTLQSKQTLIHLLKILVHFLLPVFRKCPVKFMKDVLSGKKKARNLWGITQYRLWRHISFLHWECLNILSLRLERCLLSSKQMRLYLPICLIISKGSCQTKSSSTN